MEKSDVKSALIPISAFIILASGVLFLNSINAEEGEKSEAPPTVTPITENPLKSDESSIQDVSPDTISPTPSSLPNFSVSSPGGDDGHEGQFSGISNDD